MKNIIKIIKNFFKIIKSKLRKCDEIQLKHFLKNFKFFSKKCLESLYQGIYIIQRKMMIKLEHRFKKMPSAKIDYLHYLYKNIVAKINTIDAKVIE